MTPELSQSLSLAGPELLIAAGALFLLLIGAYAGEAANRFVTGLAVVILVVAGVWVIFADAEGGAFGGVCAQQFLGREPLLFPGFGGGGFGGGGGGPQPGGAFRRGIDEGTLKQVADETGGKYYPAESADELQDVFDSLPTYLIMKHEVTELSAIFLGFGALLVAASVALARAWRPLP